MEEISEEIYKFIEAKTSSESKKKQGERPSTPRISPTIFRVPELLRKLNPSAYTPGVVSIGPLHQNDPRLIITQDHKLSYMRSLLARTAKPEDDAKQRLRECVDAIVKMTPYARTCYGESLKVEQYNDVQLATTLLVDGCFILEFLFSWKHKCMDEIIDSVFMSYLALNGIYRDLILLENQIPFCVLQQLFQRTLHKIPNLSLTQYVIQFLGDMMNSEREMTVNNGTTETETYDHILGLLHKYYEPASNGRKLGHYGVVKYSATQLHSAGVKFKDSNCQSSKGHDYLLVQFRTSCLMIYWLRNLHQIVYSWLPQKPTNSDPEQNEGVSAAEEGRSRHKKQSNCFLFFWLQPAAGQTVREKTEIQEQERNDQSSTQTSSICSRLRTLLPQTSPFNGCLFSWLFHLCSTTCLELPKLCIKDVTESFFRNLIAYEQHCVSCRRHYITSYAFLMDTLINSNEDVELLENEGVLKNYLGASKDASDLFNNLCKENFLMKFYFSDELKQLNDYCNLYWPKHLASLRSTYFSNPWAIISLIGALILFGLTALQTVYSIKSYNFSVHPIKPT